MDQSPLEAPLMKRYLLGDVSEKEQLQIEQEFLVNDDAFDQLLMIEEELIDAYVEGDLSTGDQAQFEKHMLAQPDRRQQVAFAQALKTLVAKVPIAAAPDRARPDRLSWWRWLFASPFAQPSHAGRLWAAAVIILVAAGTWLAVGTLRLRSDLAQAQIDQGKAQRLDTDLQQEVAALRGRIEQLAEELTRERSGSAPQLGAAGARQQQPLVASFILSPGLSRDTSDMRRLSIPERTEEVQLQLDLLDLDADDYSRYRATLRNADGVEIWNQDVSPLQRAAGKAVILRVPAGVLASGDHIVTLRGATKGGQFEEIGDYHFRAVKR